MTIVQSPEERERSRTVLAPWLVKLRRWRQGATTRLQKLQAKRFSKRQARILKAHAKKSAKIERKAEKAKLRLVKKEQSQVHIAYDLDTPSEIFSDPKHGRHRWHV